MEPTTLSANGFCHGLCGALMTSWMARAFTVSVNRTPKMPSRSRKRKRGTGAKGEGLAELVRGPLRSRVLGDAEVEELAAPVVDDQEPVEDLEGGRGDGKEVDADCAVEMKAEERAPGRRAGRGVLSRRHAPTDGSLGRVEAKLEKLPMDPGCAPVVLLRHLDDQVAQLLVDGWPAWMAGFEAPEEAEAGTMPAEDGVGAHEGERTLPGSPQRGEGHPEHSVEHVGPRVWLGGKGGDLLAEGEVLERELAGAEE